jgi:uncharacterized membrane protein YkgB
MWRFIFKNKASMNLMGLALTFTLFVVLITLLIFIWVGGKKFFDTVVGMRDDLHSINTNLAFFISDNNKEHLTMSKKIDSHSIQLGTHEEWLKRHEEILNSKKQ